MTPEEWQKIEAAFEHAISLEASERDRFLEELQASDAALGRKVRQMLKEDADPSDVLLEPVVAAAADLSREGPDPWLGRTFGNYEAISRIASGGMSAVYLGRRNDRLYDQDVAIKIVAGGFRSVELNTRFRTERQILASLKHPYIAQLFDGGTTTDGTPYLVMEYIEGQAIDDYCDQQRLGIDERLALFGKVCAAVDSAHRHLVVHRDVKPSNILVTADGTPKLLDFGIAKPLDATAMSQTIALTRADNRAMTPEFASPEQVRGEPITTATDVYSLGVLLYKILSGRMPYLSEGTNVAAVVRAICDTEPSKPSTAVTMPGDDDVSSRIVATRRTSVGKLQKRLAGDLDNIVMMALQKEPERRYRTVNALMEDIRRYLADEPVSARADSVGYRAGKFVRRHRSGVTVVLAFLGVIVALPSYYSMRVAEQRDLAELEAEKAASISEFLLSLFEVSDPGRAQGETITARSLLNEGAVRIEDELKGQPAVQASMQDVMGGAYLGLGLYDESEALLKRAYTTRHRLHGAVDADVLQTQSRIADLASARGQYQEAERLYRKVLEVSRELHGADSAAAARALTMLGNVIYEQSRYDEAAAQYQSALALYARPEFNDSVEKAIAMHGYGWLLTNMGQFEAAETMLRDALALLRQTLGQRHPEVPAALNHLTYLLMDTGRWDEAETTAREGLAISEVVYGSEHPDLSGDRVTLATILQNRGQYAEAEDLYRRALADDRKILGENHPYIAMDKNNLAGVLRVQGKYLESEQSYRESLALNEQLHGADHRETATSMANLGVVLVELGRFDDAGHYLRAAMEIRQRVFGNDSPQTISSINSYAGYLHRIGDYDAAKPLFEKALEARRRILGAAHPRTGSVLVQYADLLCDMGLQEEALAAVEEGLRIALAADGEMHPRTARAYFVLARVKEQQGLPDEASNNYRRSLALNRALLPPNRPRIATVLTELGRLLVENTRATEALPLLDEAATIRREALPEGHWLIGDTQSALGHCQAQLGLADAGRNLSEGRDVLLASRGRDNRYTQRAEALLAGYRGASPP